MFNLASDSQAPSAAPRSLWDALPKLTQLQALLQNPDQQQEDGFLEKFQDLLFSLAVSAVKQEEIAFLEELIQKFMKDNDSKTYLLQRAIMAREAKVVETLLVLGFDPLLPGHLRGCNAYHYVRDEETFLALHAQSLLSVDAVDANGWTPLQTLVNDTIVSFVDKKQMVALFCEFGADPSLQTPAPAADAFDLAKKQHYSGELSFILNANRHYLVLMRQIALLSPALKRTPIIQALCNEKPKSTRTKFNPQYPVDYQPMPSVVIDKAAVTGAVEVIVFAIKNQLFALLKAVLLVYGKEDSLSLTKERFAHTFVDDDMSCFLYVAMCCNSDPSPDTGAILAFILKIFYPAGLDGNDYVQLADLAIMDGNDDLIAKSMSTLESKYTKPAISQALDPVASALSVGRVAWAKRFQDNGYPIQLNHIALAATEPAVTAHQLKMWIAALPTSSRTPLSALNLRTNVNLDPVKKDILVNMGCRVFEPATEATRQQTKQLNYGAILAAEGVNKRGRNTSINRRNAIPLQVMTSSSSSSSSSATSSTSTPFVRATGAVESTTLLGRKK